MRAAGRPKVFGSVIVKGNADGGGTPDFIYDPYVVSNAARLGARSIMSGSWHDSPEDWARRLRIFTDRTRRMIGSILLEALSALVILSGGLLAVARLQGGLVNSSADAKARAEATQLAQGWIDQRRAQVQTNTCALTAARTETWSGMNAAFTGTETRAEQVLNSGERRWGGSR
jgi:hypothetical protein